jgi:hypothetical protein
MLDKAEKPEKEYVFNVLLDEYGGIESSSGLLDQHDSIVMLCFLIDQLELCIARKSQKDNRDNYRPHGRNPEVYRLMELVDAALISLVESAWWGYENELSGLCLSLMVTLPFRPVEGRPHGMYLRRLRELSCLLRHLEGLPASTEHLRITVRVVHELSSASALRQTSAVPHGGGGHPRREERDIGAAGPSPDDSSRFAER